MTLQEQIDRARAEIRTDGYPVSIGEWISIYEKNELEVHPEFRRSLRWSARKKSRLIESLLVGIPIPEVSVVQRHDGVWDVVDGFQRLSTVFEFVGILRDESNELLPPLALDGTTYLPALRGLRWQDDEHPDRSLTALQRLLIKRARIDASIISRESEKETVLELFQRLNTAGAAHDAQEIRSCILLMLNRELFSWMKSLSEDPSFLVCLALPEHGAGEGYAMELALIFVALRVLDPADLLQAEDLGELLTEKARSLAQDKGLDRKTEEEVFRGTFSALVQALGEDTFRHYDRSRDRFFGGFSFSAFVAIALGIGYDARRMRASPPRLAELVKRIWSEEEFVVTSRATRSTVACIATLVSFGRRHFDVSTIPLLPRGA